MQTTSRFNLNAPELTDEADITKISENMTTIDAEMAGLSKANTFTGVNNFTAGLNGALTGNATTATKLQTARTINGVSFDGTRNINIAINYGRTEPTLVESIVDWEAMATACNITVADLKNISNADYGTLGYGGDSGGTHIDGIKFKHGDIIFKSHVTLGPRSMIADGHFIVYDKILVINCNDNGAHPEFSLWENWELEYAYMTLTKFSIIKGGDKVWCVNGGDHTRYSNFEPFKMSGDFVPARFLCDDNDNDQNCAIVDILGIRY